MIKVIATNPYNVVFEAEIIQKAFENGLDLLYVFKPKFSFAEMEEFIQTIKPIYWPRLILAIYPSLAAKYKTRGYLVEKEQFNSFFSNLFVLTPFLKKNPNIWVYSQVKHIDQLEKLDKRAKHVFVYPVFIDSYNGNIVKLADNKALNSIRNERTVYAMGSVNESRIEETLKIGFGGFVLQSAIWRSSKPIEAFISICNQLSIEDRKSGIV